jgi:hypothetical protein
MPCLILPRYCTPLTNFYDPIVVILSSSHYSLLPSFFFPLFYLRPSSPSSFHSLLFLSFLLLPSTPSLPLISSDSVPYRVLERVWDDPFAASFIEPVDCDTYDDYLGTLFVLHCIVLYFEVCLCCDEWVLIKFCHY